MQKDTKLSFAAGLRGGVPIALGYLSVSIAFGMSAAANGFPLWAPALISMTSFTGTGQFVGVDLIASHAGMLELAFTLLIINLRYLLMSLSLSQRLAPNIGFFRRMLIAFGNTDEIYAVTMQQECALTLPYMLGLTLSSYAGWVTGTVLGSCSADILPAMLRSALGIAVYAMFIAIIVPPARKSRPVLRIVAIAVAARCLFWWTPFLNRLSSGWAIILCGTVASAYGAFFFPIKEDETEAEQAAPGEGRAAGEQLPDTKPEENRKGGNEHDDR